MNHTATLSLDTKIRSVLIAVTIALVAVVLATAAATTATSVSAAPQYGVSVGQLLDNLRNNLTNSVVGPAIKEFTPQSILTAPSLVDPPDKTQTDKMNFNNNNIPFVLPFP